jgi:triphosphatase
MPNEIELKLRIAATDVLRLRRHSAIKQHLVGKPITRRLISIYYDTPDLKLLDAAISLRVRRMSGGWFQAVKGAGHSLGGLHQRMEWEDIIAKGEPDFTKITEPFLAEIFADQALRDALKPIFITDVQRTEWQLQYEDGSAIEVALDLGELQIGELQVGKKREPISREPIREVELELKHGHANHLFDLALALQANIPLHIENVSKAQRGYAHYRPQIAGTSKAETIALEADMSADQAFRQIAGECLRHMQSNQEVALIGEDPEGVHQMRVALRRLRVAIKLFKCDVADLQDELRWLNANLAAARDWDVFLHETLPAARAALQADEPKLDLLQEQALAVRQQTHKRLKRALNSQRYARLLLNLGAVLTAEDHPIKGKLIKLAEHELQKAYETLRKYGDHLSELNAKQRHKFRIHSKYLHYAADFFADIHKGKKQALKTQTLIDHIKPLQKLLGQSNDMVVTELLLQKLARKQAQPDLQEAITLVMDWNSRRAEKTSTQVEKAWRSSHLKQAIADL